MRLNVGARRRSSVMYAPASYTPPQESAEEGTDGPPGAPGGERDTDMADADVDINEMTPEQIEVWPRPCLHGHMYNGHTVMSGPG